MCPIRLRCTSGASEVSANAFVLEAGGCRLLLDAGAARGSRAAWVDTIERPDLCWVSHAHWDHIGALGELAKHFVGLPCVSTATTRRLAALALTRGGVGRARAKAVAAQIRPVAWRRYIELAQFVDNSAAQKFRLMAFPAGHLPGAAMVLVEVDRGHRRPYRVLYTGDFCGHDQPALDGALFPRTGDDFPIDTLVTEGVLATQKDVDQSNYADQMSRLHALLGHRSGPALVGAAGLGAAAQVAASLGQSAAGQSTPGQSTKPGPVVHESVGAVIEAGGLGDGLDALETTDQAGCRRALEAGRVVVAPGQQYNPNTPAGRLLGAVVSRPDALVVVCNRVYGATPAGQLCRAADAADATVSVGGRRRALGAQIEHILLPNHAPRSQLVEAVEAINPARVVLVHGHRSQLFSLRRAIEKAGYDGAVDVPENGDVVVLAP